MDRWDKKYKAGTLQELQMFSYREPTYGATTYVYAYFHNGKRIERRFNPTIGMNMLDFAKGKEDTMKSVQDEIEKLRKA